MGTHGPGDAAASSLGPAFRQGLGALQCMPGVVVRRGRPSDSEVSSCWGRWSCCNRGRRRLGISWYLAVVFVIISLCDYPDFLSSHSGC